MILIDANLLLYAYDPDSKHHAAARSWLEGTLSGSEPVGIAWTVLLAFLRVGTDARVYPRPFSMPEAVSKAATWWQQPQVCLVVPGERHWEILSQLVVDAQVRGPVVMDADLAALAIERGATVCTADKDFTRFTGLRVVNPLESGK